ncbi:MAG TPA: hypothetical protein VFD43_10775 [Planctomycetota bacterium]|nr:hypothetical protein [Planctomycetota bacterium]
MDSRPRTSAGSCLLLAGALLVGLGACGGGGGGGGGSSPPTSWGSGSWDPEIPGVGTGSSPDTWSIGPEIDFYPPALQQSYTLENTGPDELPWNVQLSASWLQLTGSPSGTLDPGESVTVQVDADPWGADATGDDLPDAQVVFKHSHTNEVLADYDVVVDPSFAIDGSFAEGGNNGWTALSPSGDTRTVYVSASTGSDGNDGFSADTPKRTLAAGKALLRHQMPDWLLLKRGDVWQEGLGQWTKSGRSPYEPMVVAWYGSSPARPLLQTGTGDGLTVVGGNGAPSSIENVAFVGLHFQAHTYAGTVSCVGARVLNPTTHLLIEDCFFQAYTANLVLQGLGADRHEDLRVRRCVVVDAWAKHSANIGHPLGLYAYAVDGLLIEENVFDHNGWNAGVPDAGPDVFCHNLYIDNGNTDVTVRGNIIANASSHGMQLRCGGTAINNLFVRNAIALGVGGGNHPEPGGVTGLVRGNVILDGKDIDAANPRGWGIWFGNIAQGHAAYNIIAHNSQGHLARALYFAGDAEGDTGPTIGVHDLLVEHNIVRDWGGNLVVEGEAGHFSGLELRSLDVQELTHDEPVLLHFSSSSMASIESGDNRFFVSQLPAPAWTHIQLVDHSIDYWMSQVGDTTSQDVFVNYSAPGVSVESYNALLGGPANLSAFLAQARLQSVSNWRPEYTAVRVNRYVRDGFTAP